MPHSLLEIAFWLPTTDIQTAQDVLQAVAGAATVTGKTLDGLPSDTAASDAAQVHDAEHRACLIATIEQYRATVDVNFGKNGAMM